MRLRQILILSVPLALVLAFQACGYLAEPESHLLALSSSADLQEGTFAAISAKVFEPHCTQCHSGTAIVGGGYSLESYTKTMEGGRVVPGSPSSSLLVQRVRDGSMPPGGGLSNEKIALIEAWVAAGAHNEAPPEVIPEAPVANAGPDVTLTLPLANHTLMGSASDSDGVIQSILWTQVEGSPVTMMGANTLYLTISQFDVGVYKFNLLVTDNDGLQHQDQVTVIVQPNPSPVAPTANAGADQTLLLPTNSIMLMGSATAGAGTISSYQWSQLQGPSTATLTNANTATVTASNLVSGTYVFRLTVTNSGGVSATDSVTVTVNAPTYTWINQNVLIPHCIRCHGSSKAEAGVRYDTYARTLNTVNTTSPTQSKFYREVNSGSMPEDGPKLPQASINAILSWIQSGAPNN